MKEKQRERVANVLTDIGKGGLLVAAAAVFTKSVNLESVALLIAGSVLFIVFAVIMDGR